MVYSHESVKCSILKIFSKRRFIHIIFERVSTLSRAIVTTRFLMLENMDCTFLLSGLLLLFEMFLM